jgi:hypothetical protein
MTPVLAAAAKNTNSAAVKTAKNLTEIKNPSTISFGPYLTRKGEFRLIAPDMAYAGFALEYTSQDCCGDVSIFRPVSPESKPIHFEDYVVQATDVFILLDLTYERLKEPRLGSYVSLERFLAGLYQERKPKRSLNDFVAEFKQHLAVAEEVGAVLVRIEEVSKLIF